MTKLGRRAAQIIARAQMVARFGRGSARAPRHGDWVPPFIDLTDRELDVLLDAEEPHGRRRLPSTYVLDRARDALARRHLLVWKQVDPHRTSFAQDHYELTPGGRRLLARYRETMRKFGGASERA